MDERTKWFMKAHGAAEFRQADKCFIGPGGGVKFAQIHLMVSYRLNGPSIIDPRGSIIYTNPCGNYHRTNGPAVIHSDGVKEYWINNSLVQSDRFFLMYGVL